MYQVQDLSLVSWCVFYQGYEGCSSLDRRAKYWYRFSKDNLMALGNSLGRWIAIDRKNVAFVEPTITRICVEINVQEEMPKKV